MSPVILCSRPEPGHSGFVGPGHANTSALNRWKSALKDDATVRRGQFTGLGKFMKPHQTIVAAACIAGNILVFAPWAVATAEAHMQTPMTSSIACQRDSSFDFYLLRSSRAAILT
jgi:hypothetical protein